MTAQPPPEQRLIADTAAPSGGITSGGYVAQMQDAVCDVLGQIPDVAPYVEALLAHWIWVGATIDAATGERTELNDLARRLHATTQDYVDLKDENARLQLALGARNTEAELIFLEREEAWKHLVRYLCDSSGFAPEYGAKGLWVDLYDEATMNEAAGLVDGADDA